MKSTSRAIDLRALQRQFDRRSRTFAQHDFLFREAESRMAQRLDLVRLEPSRVLDLGCGNGRGFTALARRYPQAAMYGADLSWQALHLARSAWGGPLSQWWKSLIGGARVRPPILVQAVFGKLPLATASFDLVVSNLALHFADDAVPVFADLARILNIGGLLMFTCFGPDTLKEVRAAWQFEDAPAPVLSFTDMHDLGDMLLEVGFADPIVDMEVITLTYTSVDRLLVDLHAVTGNPLLSRGRALGGKRRLQHAREALEAQRDDQGLIRITIELVNGHAWKAAPRQQSERLPDGSHIAYVPFDPRIRTPRTRP